MRVRWLLFLLFAQFAAALCAKTSHSPMRPLPSPSSRPMADGPARFVDARRGSDRQDGSKSRPWKSIQHAVAQLAPGDTLYLHGGTYYERVKSSVRGTKLRPVTIRSFPGELAVIDGGFSEFYESPESAWEPVTDGAAGEFRSTRRYPQLAAFPERTNLLGNFGDSMIPLHGYRFLSDLRSDNHKFRKLAGSKTARGNGLYCGPGLFYETQTQRIHVRLKPTEQPSLGEENNYGGEQDPRKIPLIVAGHGPSPLELHRAVHVVLQDLVVQGSRDATINLVDCSNITLDRVTSYGGSSALRIEGTSGLRCVNSAFRGIAAPWLWRWSLKYRSIEARIVSASQWNPPARGNRDFVFAYCEFTDCVDGVFIGNVASVSIHHCLLDNLSDDGFFITCRTAYDGTTPGGDFEFHHNRISRVLSAFAFGVGHGRQRTINGRGDKQLGRQTVIRNNVFALRDPVLYQQPAEGPITTFGRLAGDHGSPAWEPIDFIANTVFFKDSPWRSYYAAGWSKSMGKGTRRRILRNIFEHERGLPGQVLPAKMVDFEAGGNWHWSKEAGAEAGEVFLSRFRSSPLFKETGWTKGDVYASPKKAPDDVGAGKDVPIGVNGRLMMFGNETKKLSRVPTPRMRPFAHAPRGVSGERVALVLGYPAFDAPMLKFVFEKAGSDVEVFERTWLPAEQYSRYRCVAMLGSTVRAKMQPSGFSATDHEIVHKYLQDGGTLLIGRELLRQVFPGDGGRRFVESLLGTAPRSRDSELRILKPDHPWLSHVKESAWIANAGASPIPLSRSANLIGDPETSRSILADVPVGRGRVIYVGWDLSRFLPHGRRPSTPEQESDYEVQYRIYERIVSDVLGTR